jgi:hypothetical protein
MKFALVLLATVGAVSLGCEGSTKEPSSTTQSAAGGACAPPAATSVGAGCQITSLTTSCGIPNGGEVLPDGAVLAPDGAILTCQSDCGAGQFAISCEGASPTAAAPSPNTTLQCKAYPTPTPVNIAFYCCPCQ